MNIPIIQNDKSPFILIIEARPVKNNNKKIILDCDKCSGGNNQLNEIKNNYGKIIIEHSSK